MYEEFAQVYDELMKEIDYTKWSNYIERLVVALGILPAIWPRRGSR